MSDQNETDKKTQAELRMVYQETLNDIRDLKRLQWTVTYYGLLLYAALVGYVAFRTPASSASVTELSLVERGTLLVLAWAMAVFGGWYLVKTQRSLGDFRNQIRRIWKHFDEVTKAAIGVKQQGTTLFRHFEILLALILTLIAGAGVICWLLFNDVVLLLLFVGTLLVVMFIFFLVKLSNKGNSVR